MEQMIYFKLPIPTLSEASSLLNKPFSMKGRVVGTIKQVIQEDLKTVNVGVQFHNKEEYKFILATLGGAFKKLDKSAKKK